MLEPNSGSLCKYIRFLMPNELHHCRLWIAFGELANTYYRDEGRRAKARLEKKNYTSVELNVRYCFKVRFLLSLWSLFIFVSRVVRNSMSTAVTVKFSPSAFHIFSARVIT